MKLMSLLPFMETKEIQELAAKIISGEVKGISLITLFPFLPKEDLVGILNQLIETKQYRQIYGMLPFLASDDLDSLYEQVKDGKLEGFKEQALLPFLGKDQLKGLFDNLVEQATKDAKDTVEATVGDLFDEEADDE